MGGFGEENWENCLAEGLKCDGYNCLAEGVKSRAMVA